MNTVIRVDSGLTIGSGHVMRCLVLADYFRKKNKKVVFVCRKAKGDLSRLIRQKGHQLYLLPEYSFKDRRYFIDKPWPINIWKTDAALTGELLLRSKHAADLLIVDHYGLGQGWESRMRPFCKKIMVIDDLANRTHDCDMLLDQNYYSKTRNRYQGLVPRNCRLFLGPKYALLRDEFYNARKMVKKRDGIVRSILIFFGGMDIQNVTEKALRSIKVLQKLSKITLKADVVIGFSNLHFSKIRQLCSSASNINLHIQVSNMARLMAHADLSIGAAGITTWERCFMGLPSIVVTLAENQVESAAALAKKGVIWNAGYYSDVGVRELSQFLQRAATNTLLMKRMSSVAMNLMRRHVKVPEMLFKCLYAN